MSLALWVPWIASAWGGPAGDDWVLLPAYEADPKAILAAAANAPRGENEPDARILLDETVIRFDAEGRKEEARRMVFVVDTVAGAENWGTFGAWWSAWHQDRPVIDARVIAPDGSEARLDASHLGEAVDPGMDPILLTDSRLLRGPLPRMQPGSVVEETWVVKEHQPFLAAGGVSSVWLVGDLPVGRTRVVVEAPDALPLKWEVRGADLEPDVSKGKGVRRLELDVADGEVEDGWEPYAPSDVMPPVLQISTAKSWNAMATAYSAMVEEKLDGVDVAARAATTTKGLSDPRDKAAALLADVQKSVRYVGIEFGVSAIVPAKPPDVLSRGYGDCKDKATLLVALLRASGFDAQVALLMTGPGSDVPPELPGLDAFNHAIVHTSSPVELWIDPTSDFAGIGDLPHGDQGRYALIASPKTKDLDQTPRLGADANVYRVSIDVDVDARGGATVRETRTTTGWIAQSLRSGYADQDAAATQERIEGRVKSRFSGEKARDIAVSPPRDVTQPFTIAFAADDTYEAWAADDEVMARAHYGDALEWLPWQLTTPPAEPDPADPPEPRKHPFEFAPSLTEIEKRIHLPEGYLVNDLPADVSGSAGPIRWSQTWKVEGDGLIVQRIRIDTGDARLAADQYDAARKAISDLVEDEIPLVHFPHAAEVAFRERRTADALRIHQELLAANPDDPVFVQRWGFALLRAGFGGAAREQVARAASLAPDQWEFTTNVGRVLMYDLDGRMYQPGFDRAGAVAALEKAIALDPKEQVSYEDLASVHVIGDDGKAFGPGSDPDAAIEVMRRLREATGSHQHDALLADYLARRERWKECLDVAREMPAGQDRWKYEVASTVVLEGRQAGLALATKLAANEDRRALVHAVGGEMMRRRRYADAAAFFDVAASGAANAVQLRELARLLSTLQRFEDVQVDPDDPADVYVMMLQAVRQGDEEMEGVLARGISKGDPALVAKFREDVDKGLATAQNEQLPSEVAMDVAMGAIQPTSEGDAKGGWRVRWQTPDGQHDMLAYVVKERGRARLRAFGNMPAELGAEALERAERGDDEGARRWLGWAWDEFRTITGDDPFTGTVFARVWRGGVDVDPARVRVAAAALAGVEPLRVESSMLLLEAERSRTDDAALQLQIDRALADGYWRLARWEDALAAADRMLAQRPDAAEALFVRAVALSELGQLDVAREEVNARLAKKPDDEKLLRVAAGLAEKARDVDGAAAIYVKLIGLGKANGNDYNQAAWYALANPAQVQQGLAWSMQANQIEQFKSSASMHTLATLLVEAGRPEDAREVLVQALDTAKPEGQGNVEAWDYLRGRLAESWGLPDVAGSLYARIPAPAADAYPLDVRLLAQKRAAALAQPVTR